MGKYYVEEIISAISFITVFSLLQLPYETIHGSPVPMIIFRGRPSYFHAFLLGLNFAFCGGVMTVFLKHLYPKVADFCRLFSLLSITIAGGVFTGLAVPLAIRALFINASLVATA